jgi:murein tripeptide amidase MpaA
VAAAIAVAIILAGACALSAIWVGLLDRQEVRVIKAGVRVRLRPEWAKEQIRQHYQIEDWLQLPADLRGPATIEELVGCEGVVVGNMEETWPEWEVLWEPSGLRYGYPAEALEVVDAVRE